VVATGLLGLSVSAYAAAASTSAPGQGPEVGSKSAGIAAKQSGSPKSQARKPMRKPDAGTSLVYEIINTVRSQSEELCARYGNQTDCLEEAEICLTMLDPDENQVRLCLNTVPKTGGSEVRTVRARR
jgi:hypothetical protein